MKSGKKFRAIVLLVFFSLFIVFFGKADVFADVSTTKDGIDYKLSENGEYIIVIGYSDVLPNVTVPAEIEGLPVKEISKSAFQNQIHVYSITLPDSVEIIGEAAFRNCASLVSVKLPSGLKELPFEGFRDCKVLSSIEFPETLEKIDDLCFQGCTKLGKTKIPASINHLGYDVFLNCESILLDCSENEYAKEYAVKFNVNTDFKGTSMYFALMMALGTAVAAVIAIIIIFFFRRHIKNHPTHNPGIYIGKFFSMLGRGIRFVFSKLWAGVMVVVDFVISLLEKREKKK